MFNWFFKFDFPEKSLLSVVRGDFLSYFIFYKFIKNIKIKLFFKNLKLALDKITIRLSFILSVNFIVD